jgi:hypothetical protein
LREGLVTKQHKWMETSWRVRRRPIAKLARRFGRSMAAVGHLALLGCCSTSHVNKRAPPSSPWLRPPHRRRHVDRAGQPRPLLHQPCARK